MNASKPWILGISFIIGCLLLGMTLGKSALDFKAFERSVTVKGLSEREYPADIVIWPIQFNIASNELSSLYQEIEQNTQAIKQFLTSNGLGDDDITVSSPNITDKSAQQYGGNARAEFRYTAFQTVTVYSNDIDTVRAVMGKLSDLGKQGIVLTGGNYNGQTEYLFTRLNDVKPEMVEEATRKAREVAEKFASDSQSRLGKIKRASQGQFTISARDNNNPHIKKVRVVSTVEYYLSD
ncbi:SIMPL domain-containing protein [Alteromonas facilis]|uniref:SIMPL domain-containing protein n=1 Tax=Alteromonas facilis TaxID=2048004 RepID=UPI000C286587|nr:SIMPL domain-containing protein [Alteromonas facilis]